MSRSSLLLLFGLLISPVLAHAQNGSIEGQVLEAESGDALPGTNVALAETEIGTATDADGRFALEKIPPGTYTLRASLVGYRTVTREIQVERGVTVQLQIELDQEIMELSSITVTGRRAGYETDETITATRMAAPIIELPVSVQAVPRQVMEDQQVTELREVTRNVSGVYRANTFGGTMDRFRIRGFSQNVMLRNGFRTGGGVSSVIRETADLARVEVLKGPSSVLYGRLEPGGIINLVSEDPTPEDQYRIELRGGSYGFAEPSIDFSGPLNESGSLAYRLNALYSRKDGFREPLERLYQRYYLAPVLSWEVTDETTLRLEGSFMDDERPFDRGLVAVGDGIADIPHDRALGEPGDFKESTQLSASYTLTHRFNPHLTLRNRFQYFRDDYFTIENTPFGDVDSEGELSRYNYSNDKISQNFSLQTNLVGNFETGSIGHRTLVGLDLDRDKADWRGWSANSSYRVTTINIYDPEYDDGTPGRDELDFQAVDRNQEFDAAGLLFQDQITVGENWHVLVGGRYDVADQENLDLMNDTTTTQTDHAFSPRAGLVYRPLAFVSLYGSVSRSFQPNNGQRVDGSIIDPERGTQYETGVKTQWLGGRLSSTLSAFRITKSNLSTPDPENQGFQVATGEVRSQGLEVDVSGQLTDGVQVIGAYAYTDAEVTRDNSDNVGNELVNVPDHGGSLWSTYEIQQGSLRGLRIGGGLFFVGERQGNLANNYQLPRYTRIDASISYGLGDWRARLKLNNLLDTEHVISPGFGRVAIAPGIPFKAVGSISVTL